MVFPALRLDLDLRSFRLFLSCLLVLVCVERAWAQDAPGRNPLTDPTNRPSFSSTRGQTLYQSLCEACHSPDFNGNGPAHRGVFGRRAGSVAGFAYSQAVKTSGVVWDEANLNRWLADPEKTIAGQRMYVGVESEQDRRDLIAYLKTLSFPTPSRP